MKEKEKRYCLNCGVELPENSRASRVFCDVKGVTNKCAVAWHRKQKKLKIEKIGEKK
jgi:hypothetical protein